MARSKGPDLSSTAENPNFETHVGRVERALGDASATQRINGGRWYRGAYQDAKDVAMGVAPGVHIEHPNAEAAAHGITYPKPGSTGQGGGREELLRHRADNEWRQQQHASSVGQGQDLAERGEYGHQQVSHVNHQGMPHGSFGGSERVRRASYLIAAESPAGPTGMDWQHNSRAAYETTQLAPEHVAKIRAANALPKATPERKAASAEAREPFKGKAINHATTQNVEKGLDIWEGKYTHPTEAFTPMKTRHFGNDIWSEHSLGHRLNYSGETGTADKHMVDVMGGERTGWGHNDKATGYTVRNGANASAESMLPKETTPAGYAYHRDVIQEASRRAGYSRPKVAQATSWVVEKDGKEATGAGRNGRGSRAKAK
jgi:hypothetical protein